MAQAADLNLRLMKWRMWYVLCTYSVFTVVKYYGSNIMSYDFVLILVWCIICVSLCAFAYWEFLVFGWGDRIAIVVSVIEIITIG